MLRALEDWLAAVSVGRSSCAVEEDVCIISRGGGVEGVEGLDPQTLPDALEGNEDGILTPRICVVGRVLLLMGGMAIFSWDMLCNTGMVSGGASSGSGTNQASEEEAAEEPKPDDVVLPTGKSKDVSIASPDGNPILVSYPTPFRLSTSTDTPDKPCSAFSVSLDMSVQSAT